MYMYIPLSDVGACIRDGHGLMTTVEFPCSNPLRALSPHDTYRGRNSDAHAIAMLPLRRHVGYVQHVMFTRQLSPFVSSMLFPGGGGGGRDDIKNCAAYTGISRNFLFEYFSFLVKFDRLS